MYADKTARAQITLKNTKLTRRKNQPRNSVLPKGPIDALTGTLGPYYF